MRKRQLKKNTCCSYIDGSMYSKFSTFRPDLTSVLKSFDLDHGRFSLQPRLSRCTGDPPHYVMCVAKDSGLTKTPTVGD